MGTSKTETFSTDLLEMSELLKAIAPPARLAIIEYLLEVNSCICGDIVDVLPLAQPTVSLHLKELKNVGIIKGTVEGKNVCYCLDQEKFSKIAHYFNFSEEKLIKNKCC